MFFVVNMYNCRGKVLKVLQSSLVVVGGVAVEQQIWIY